MMKDGKYTTEEAMAALAMTAEEVEEMEQNPDERESLPPMGNRGPYETPVSRGGRYGSLFWDYLKENHPGRHGYLLAETTLREVCLEVDREAREMMESLTRRFHAEKPRPTGDFMAAVRYETAIRDKAEEIVLSEIVYRPR